MIGHNKAVIEGYKSTIASIEQHLRQLKSQLAVLEAEELRSAVSKIVPSDLVGSDSFSSATNQANSESAGGHSPSNPTQKTLRQKAPRLGVEEYKRYGRQMITPGFGLQGQLRLKHAKVLVVGVGGLGSPAAAYLAGAGIGTLGLVDGDTVELSNLHRQIIHSSDKLGRMKVESAIEYLERLNPRPCYRRYPFHLTPANALGIFQEYDVILDCTDHPTSRYLISDAAVISNKILITASATKAEGQLMILGNVWKDQPCYRCIFPNPPSPETVQSCSDSGILGPVVGVMGVLMAVEAIKLLTQFGIYDEDHNLSWKERTATSTLLLYSAYDVAPFRTTYLKCKSRKNCAACSPKAAITRESLDSGSYDYAVFCGITAPINVLSEGYRVSMENFNEFVMGGRPLLKEGENPRDHPDYGHYYGYYILVDVRETQDFDMLHIEGSFNLPYSIIDKAIRNPDWLAEERDNQHASNRIWQLERHINAEPLTDVYFICRYGNDSQKAVDFLINNFNEEFACFNIRNQSTEGTVYDQGRFVADIIGGLRAWSKADPTFPEY